MFIANFVVRKVADNPEFFILTTSIDECDHNDSNGLFLFICLCCYTKCIWMSSIKYSWFNVFYAVLKWIITMGICLYVTWEIEITQSMRIYIYTWMASTCIWNGTQFVFISGLLTILNGFVFMVFMASVSI